jgi:hypothetical protein
VDIDITLLQFAFADGNIVRQLPGTLLEIIRSAAFHPVANTPQFVTQRRKFLFELLFD